LKGFAEAVCQGVDARLRLVEREGSPDQDLAKELLADLGMVDDLPLEESMKILCRSLRSRLK
jgi:hypothetical protein